MLFKNLHVKKYLKCTTLRSGKGVAVNLPSSHEKWAEENEDSIRNDDCTSGMDKGCQKDRLEWRPVEGQGERHSRPRQH